MLNNSTILEAYYRYREEHDAEMCQNFNYVEITNEFDEIFDELNKYLPDSKNDLLSKIDEIFMKMVAFDSKRSYFYGFKDGANLIIDIKQPTRN